ncbi:MAG: methyltransferase domain-containing protein [Streptosporangiales bacterium]|nr:methyltransferase domain-containing protein [Streptosporangiales bacterium]
MTVAPYNSGVSPMQASTHHHHQTRVLPKVFAGHSTRVYDLLARRLLRGFYRRIAEDVADAAPDGGAVLDVGTGPGVLLTEIARRRADVRLTGIDLSADMVATAQRNVAELGERVSAQVADVAGLPFPDDAFDLVVTSLSLHHWDDVESAVAELARVLRPGGRLYVYDFPAAPFSDVVATADARGLFTGGASRRTTIRTGVLFPRRCVRHVMYAAGG